jgi:hypothetical protein
LSGILMGAMLFAPPWTKRHERLTRKIGDQPQRTIVGESSLGYRLPWQLPQMSSQVSHQTYDLSHMQEDWIIVDIDYHRLGRQLLLTIAGAIIGIGSARSFQRSAFRDEISDLKFQT